jgi:hypothetical protein
MRWWNMPRLLHRILSEMEPHKLEIRVHVAVQGTDPVEADAYGMAKTNEILDCIPVGSYRSGWVFLWADDCLPEPPLFRRIGELIEANNHVRAIVFRQRRGTGGCFGPANAGMMKLHGVFGDQVCCNRDFLADDRYAREQHWKEADAVLWQTIHERPGNREKFLFCDEPLLGYNILPHNQ